MPTLRRFEAPAQPTAFRATFIPVVPFHATEAELAAIARLQEHAERDVVVRVTPPATAEHRVAERLRHITTHTRTPAERLHAVLDVGYVERATETRIDQLTGLATIISESSLVRFIGMLAGSVPARRADLGTITRDRPEVDLWRGVSARWDIQYGDYGVVHPDPPATDPGPVAIPNPYLNYTIAGKSLFLYRRLIRTNRRIEPGAAEEAFAEIADELVSRPEFAGSSFSWGDRQLARCRLGGSHRAGAAPR
jgi:T4 beta protein